MSPKSTDDFKRIAKAIAGYFVIAVLFFPIFHLLRGDFSWRDTLINVGLNLLVAVLLGAIYYFGSHIPKSNQE